jgi:hypothetical protein
MSNATVEVEIVILPEMQFKQRLFIENIDGSQTLFFENCRGVIMKLDKHDVIGEVISRLQVFGECDPDVTAYSIWNSGRFSYDVSDMTRFSFISYTIVSIFGDKVGLRLETIQERNDRVAPRSKIYQKMGFVCIELHGDEYVLNNHAECTANGYRDGEYRINFAYDVVGNEKWSGKTYKVVNVRYPNFTYN